METLTTIGAARTTVSVRVARSQDELVHAFVIRGLVFVGEQACPYAEEFDGNDAVAMHLVAYVGAEPAGTLRLRWFASFAKIEHVAVRREYRKIGICRHLTEEAVAIAARKGYGQLYGTAQIGKLPVWLNLGFRPVDKPHFAFSDYEYVPIERKFEIPVDAIIPCLPDLLLIRPEGAWDEPGVLDLSAERWSTPKVA